MIEIKVFTYSMNYEREIQIKNFQFPIFTSWTEIY